MSLRLLRSQLPPLERELFDLNYLDPYEAETFARNLITDLFPTNAEGAPRPLVTIYAAPVQATEVGHAELIRRIQDPGLKSVEPTASVGPLVPGITRSFGGGVIAHDGNRGFSDMTSAFVLRTTGSVELVEGGATAALEGRSMLYLRHTLLRTAQVLGYLFLFGEWIQRDEWTLVLNVRDARGAALGNHHPCYRQTFSSDPHDALERHLQFRGTVNRGDEEQKRATVKRLDDFLSFAYGYREARGHDESGWLARS